MVCALEFVEILVEFLLSRRAGRLFRARPPPLGLILAEQDRELDVHLVAGFARS